MAISIFQGRKAYHCSWLRLAFYDVIVREGQNNTLTKGFWKKRHIGPVV